ncbi:hypothetical protein H4R33_005162 [Dimargaris cristalligena]|nr:hypothetical protein H4R33_005162 [Dimargaris cristalligena]
MIEYLLLTHNPYTSKVLAASTNFFGVGKGQEEQFDQIDSTLPDINWVLEMMGQEDTSNYFDWNAFQNPSSHSLVSDGSSPETASLSQLCPYCPRRIRDNQCYERHLRLHDANDTSAALLCEYCQGRFRTQGYLNRHRLTCRNPRTCPHCHRSFKHQTNFRLY